MKNNRYLSLLVPLLSLFLAACGTTEPSVSYNSLDGKERIDQAVRITESTGILKLDDSKKTALYQALDTIGTDTTSPLAPDDYRQITKIETEAAYVDFVKQTHDTPQLLYIGFDECPWCKAFSPKVNQFASELSLPIHYYNTRERESDVSYQEVMKDFKIDTVPQLFVMKEGKVIASIHSDSSMEDMENFFTSYAQTLKKQDS